MSEQERVRTCKRDGRRKGRGKSMNGHSGHGKNSGFYTDWRVLNKVVLLSDSSFKELWPKCDWIVQGRGGSRETKRCFPDNPHDRYQCKNQKSSTSVMRISPIQNTF